MEGDDRGDYQRSGVRDETDEEAGGVNGGGEIGEEDEIEDGYAQGVANGGEVQNVGEEAYMSAFTSRRVTTDLLIYTGMGGSCFMGEFVKGSRRIVDLVDRKDTSRLELLNRRMTCCIVINKSMHRVRSCYANILEKTHDK